VRFDILEGGVRFAKIVFLVAGVWGFLVLTPLYFMKDVIGRGYPPPITHPDFYYGFIGVALVWQLAFLLIASDPARFRPMMIPAILEKFGYVATLLTLHLQGQLPPGAVMVAAPDFVLGLLFVAAFVKTAGSEAAFRRGTT
jgi:hypothetical protein